MSKGGNEVISYRGDRDPRKDLPGGSKGDIKNRGQKGRRPRPENTELKRAFTGIGLSGEGHIRKRPTTPPGKKFKAKKLLEKNCCRRGSEKKYPSGRSPTHSLEGNALEGGRGGGRD